MSAENLQGVTVAMIAAMARNRVIGINNQLPWYLPNDLRFFKAVTMGKPIIMGRKTFQSIGKPLPGRTNIIITRDPDYRADGVVVVHSVDQAIEKATSVAELDGASEVMVIGGAEIYQAVLPRADRLYLTRVEADVDGDAWFPGLVWSQWQQTEREQFAAEGPNPYDYAIEIYQKVVPNQAD